MTGILQFFEERTGAQVPYPLFFKRVTPVKCINDSNGKVNFSQLTGRGERDIFFLYDYFHAFWHGREREDMGAHPHAEKRAEKRELFTVTIEYTYTSLNEGRISCQTNSGLSVNLSASGLGFYTDKALQQGQRLTLYSKKLKDFTIEAQVRWCSKLSDSIYRMGVSFLPDTPDNRSVENG